MRLFIVGALLLLATSGAAQSRWTFSAGPEWHQRYHQPGAQYRMWGVRLRAEYDLARSDRVFGLRLEGGGRWSPNQGFFWSGSSAGASREQILDLMLGLNASLSPLPHARFSPYITAGVFGQQIWTSGASFRPNGTYGNSTYTVGGIAGALGVGLRARLGQRAFQLELRRMGESSELTLGTRLPF